MSEMHLRGRHVALLNLGCKVNACETDGMKNLLEQAGCELTDFDNADIYIINTCSVTNIADRKSRQMLHRARQINPDALIVATGCYAQIGGERLIKDGSADIVVGNNYKSKLIEAIGDYLDKKDGCLYTGDMTREHRYDEFRVSDCDERSRAFIKIEDGCNQFCSYCIIPFARGRVRSRKEEDILEEIRGLADKGYREVVLTGIHVSSYGIENYEKTDGFRYEPLLGLIRKVAAVPGIERIRLGSLEPRIITEEFAAALAGIPRLCPHFHLSLQSGCDSVLKRMHRHYSAEEFLDRCDILRKAFDRPSINTDVIVGFPGESEEEFVATCEFARRAAFAKMHIFKYSRRRGTVADRMDGQLTEAVKKQRSEKLMAIDDECRENFRTSFIGDCCSILVEKIFTENGVSYASGLTERYVEAAVPVGDQSYGINDIVDIRITGVLSKECLLAEPYVNVHPAEN